MSESGAPEKQKKALETKSVVNERFYAFMVPVFNAALAIFAPLRASGTENIPREGPFIMCANHITGMDPFLLAVRTPGRYVRFMGKAELFEGNRLVAWFIRALGAFPVHRGQRDMAAMRECLNLLKEGHAVGIFPQGTRSPENKRLKMENGVALIALRAKAPVIPAFISGKLHFFRRTTITFGAPVPLEDLWGRFDAESMNEATERIEEAVWGMQGKE